MLSAGFFLGFFFLFLLVLPFGSSCLQLVLFYLYSLTFEVILFFLPLPDRPGPFIPSGFPSDLCQAFPFWFSPSPGSIFMFSLLRSSFEDFLFLLSRVISRKKTEWVPFPHLSAFPAAFRMLAFVSLESRVILVIGDFPLGVGSIGYAPMMFS